MRLFLELANIPVDAATNMPLPQDSTDSCFAPAMKQISKCYFTGAGVAAIDTGVGLAWLESAHTAAGDVDAAHDVALVYEYGHYGVAHDVVRAAEWFHKAADAGNMEAMAELGLCYELGCGVEQSDEEALDWYMKAADKGHLVAKFSVGEAFEEARGVPQSDAEACLWYYKAAIEGDEDSRKALRRLEDIARIVVPGAGALLDA
jgi:TPR repeat protein